MDKNCTLEIVKIVAPISVAFIGMGLGWHYFKKKAYADTIFKYAERYDKVMDAFPPGTFLQRFNSEADLPGPDGKLRLAVLKYLNLCSEEYYLYKRGYLAKDVWRIWEEELLRTLRSQLFRREWDVLKDEFKSDAAFTRFVNEVQRETLAE